jgi:molybdopterin converting factor small subunit
MANLLFFGSLPNKLGLGSQDIPLPLTVKDVRGLLAWLRKRGRTWELYLAEDRVQVTVNKQFAEPDTPVSDEDEIAIVSIGLR